MNCTHYSCRCARAAELAAMGLTLEAVQIHNQDVRCRMVEPSIFSVSRVEQLRMIAEKIEPVLSGMTQGSTGYLDDRVVPTEPAMKGVDAHGRTFVTLCLRSTESGGRDVEAPDVVRVGVVTIFQRYSDDDKVVVQACNSRLAPRFIEGAARDEDMSRLQELISARRVSGRDQDGRVLFELVSPAAALHAPKA